MRELVKAARARAEELTGPDGSVEDDHRHGAGVRARGGDDRAPRLRQARRGGPQRRQLPQRHPGQDGADRRRRPGARSRCRGTGRARSSRSIVRKRQRRLSDVDAVVISLYAKGLTTGEISAHFAEVYGASVSKDTVSRITDRVVEDMQAWSSGRCSRCTRRSSSTRSTSRSATGRSATSRSTPRSGSTWTGTATCSGCGPGTAAGSRRSSG